MSTAAVTMVVPVLTGEYADYGVIQRGSVYQMKVPLKLGGFFAEPMRYRTVIHENDFSHVLLKLQQGAVGRAVSGVYPNLVLEIYAYEIGTFEFDVIITSEVCNNSKTYI
jgi:hypothetical protein